jgi:ADP-ribose pyrophosphatase YjhB (NUDIX family)
VTLQDHEIRREYPTAPLIGVGAVIVDEDCVVLVRRGKPPALGEWSIPGGLVWLGETLKEAVAREAHEETGIEVRVDALVELLERIFPDEHGRIRYHYVLADFSCRVVGGELKAGSDAMDAKWVRREDLVSFDLAPVTMKVVLKALDQQVAIHRMTNARS